MNDQSRDDRLDELLALAALGELTASDEQELDAALAADAHLQEELDADLDAAARVQAVNAEAPPAGLKDRVMAAIEATDVAAGDTAPPAAPIVSLADERDRRRSRWIPMAAAAAVAFIAVAGVVVLRDDDNSNDVAADVIAAPDANGWDFVGDLPGSLRAVYSAEVDTLVLEGVAVDQPTENQTYQLWLVDPAANSAESVGVFRPDDQGRVLLAFAGADPSNLTLGITVEPSGGSEQPTLPIIAAVDTTA